MMIKDVLDSFFFPPFSDVCRKVDYNNILGCHTQSCSSPLGLEDRTIPNLQISSSLPLSQPSNARLNNPDSAWCFNYTEVSFSPSSFSKLGKILFFS